MAKDIYSGIFDIVTDELEKNDIKFKFSKQSYMYMTKCSPYNINVPDLFECADNRTFLETAYIAFLQRPVDDKAYENWSKRFSEPEDVFRNAVILTLVSSQEFANAVITVENNIYSTENMVNSGTASAGSAVRWPEKLLRLYRKQPEFIKKAVKKSMGMK
jgi:hypothetical protein